MTFLAMTKATAQNPKIKCYFNHPVNTALSTGVAAVNVKSNLPKTVVSYINKAKYSLDFAMYQYNSKAKDVVSVIAAANVRKLLIPNIRTLGRYTLPSFPI